MRTRNPTERRRGGDSRDRNSTSRQQKYRRSFFSSGQGQRNKQEYEQEHEQKPRRKKKNSPIGAKGVGRSQRRKQGLEIGLGEHELGDR